ncbi:MAG: hypothetical protein ACLTAS_04635 [Butyribacter sp.]
MSTPQVKNFKADLAIRYYNPEKLTGKKLHYELIRRDVSAAETTGFAVNGETSVVTSGDVKIPDGAKELVQLGGISFAMPRQTKLPCMTLSLRLTAHHTKINMNFIVILSMMMFYHLKISQA